MATKKVSSVYTELRARLDKYERDLQKARGQTNKYAGYYQKRFNQLNFDKAASSLKAFIGAFAGAYALRQFTSFMSENVELAASWERELLRTEALIKSTGMAAGFSSQQLADFATELDRTTLFDKRGILDAINIMQTFRKVQGSVFMEAIRLSADLAEINQTSVRATALQMAKLLEAPDRLLSSLTRSGIIFDKQQERLIKDLVASNRLLEAQRIVLDKIGREVGGAATGAGGGLAGKIDLLKFKWGEFREALAATGAATAGIDAISNALDKLTEKLKSGDLAEYAKKFFYTFVPLGRGLKGIEQLKEWGKEYFKFFADFENKLRGIRVPDPWETAAGRTFTDDQIAKLKELNKATEVVTKTSDKHIKTIEELNAEYLKLLPSIRMYRDSWEKIAGRDFTEKQLEALEKLKNESESLQSKGINEALTSAFKEVDEVAKESFSALTQLSERTAWAMQQNFSDFFFDAMQGKLNSLKDFFNSVTASMQRALADLLGQQITTGLFGKDFKGGGWFDSIFSSKADKSYAGGGLIPERVRGFGMSSGKSYEFHANETVSGMGAGGVQVAVNVVNNLGQQAEIKQSTQWVRPDMMVADIVLNKKLSSRSFRQGLR